MRILFKVAVYAVIGVLILFVSDWGIFAMRRSRGRGMEIVAVDQFVAGSLKGNKTEFDYVGTVNQSCSQTLFPQYAASEWNPPCWWLRQHRTHWESVRIEPRTSSHAFVS